MTSPPVTPAPSPALSAAGLSAPEPITTEPITAEPSAAEPSAPQPEPRVLPRRPQLRPGVPILRRPGAVQVGFDSQDAIVVAPAGTGLVRWLRLLDGTRGMIELQRSGARLDLGPDQLRQVLHELAAARLLSADPDQPTGGDRALAARRRVRLVGAGRLGRAIARSLATADLGVLELVDDDPVDQAIYSLQG